MTVKSVKAFETSDGSLFQTKSIAQKHEEHLKKSAELKKIEAWYESHRIYGEYSGLEWGELLDWLGANREKAEAILDWLKYSEGRL